MYKAQNTNTSKKTTRILLGELLINKMNTKGKIKIQSYNFCLKDASTHHWANHSTGIEQCLKDGKKEKLQNLPNVFGLCYGRRHFYIRDFDFECKIRREMALWPTQGKIITYRSTNKSIWMYLLLF